MKPLASMLAAAGLIALGALAPHSSVADSQSDYLVRDGMVIYYAIVPAAPLRLYPSYSAERRMHGGIPKGRDVHHLMVALFDAASRERIADAKVTATVAEAGFGGQRKNLEPFVANESLTYCNFFTISPRTDYHIRIDIRRPGSDAPSRLEFGFRP